MMFTRFKTRLVTLLQLFLVLLFILFEEIVWEGIAKPIYAYVHTLRILQKVEGWLQRVNAGVILVLFVVLLLFVELLGIYAGVLFVSGQVLLGLMLYASKIPIAAFTFWMFRVTESKLMQFGWFKWLYEKMMAAIGWLKSLEIYQSTMHKLKATRQRLKEWITDFKAAYLSQESRFVRGAKRLYRKIKAALRKH
jgi:membrane-bound ClpP family serine protease